MGRYDPQLVPRPYCPLVVKVKNVALDGIAVQERYLAAGRMAAGGCQLQKTSRTVRSRLISTTSPATPLI